MITTGDIFLLDRTFMLGFQPSDNADIGQKTGFAITSVKHSNYSLPWRFRQKYFESCPPARLAYHFNKSSHRLYLAFSDVQANTS